MIGDSTISNVSLPLKLYKRLFQQAAPLSGVLGLCQKTGAYHGPQLHHGAVPVGVPLG